jgi:uncharacterized protein (DUF1330 family)
VNRHITLGLAAVAGAAAGAVAVQSLHAQPKPVAFVIADIGVTNRDGFANGYVPPMTKSIVASGGKFLVRGGATLPIEGEPPKSPVVVLQFENMDKVQAWINSSAFRDAQPIGRKNATFRTYAVEGVSQ